MPYCDMLIRHLNRLKQHLAQWRVEEAMNLLRGIKKPNEEAAMGSDIEDRFIKKRVEDTRCPELIRAAGVEADHVYLLRERIDCGAWELVADHFVPIKGKYILTKPTSARSYFTEEPGSVVSAMKSKGLW